MMDRTLQVVEIPTPGSAEGYLRVRVLVGLISGLDVDIEAGRRPYSGIPGTSFVGVVEDARDPEDRRLLGKRVVVRAIYGCGICDACRTGFEDRCRDRIRPGLYGAGGGHVEYVSLPSRAVVVVPDAVSDEAAVLAPSVAAIYEAISRGNLPHWTNVLVIGDGGMGMLTALSLASAGYTVTLRGKHGDRFDILRRHGIHFNLATEEDELIGARPGRFGPALASYPFVFEATGKASGWDAALRLVSPGGTVYELSSFQDRVPRRLTAVFDRNIRVLGLRQGPLEPVLSIFAAGLFDPTEVVGPSYLLDEGPQAYANVRTHRDRLALLRVSHLED